MSSARRRCVTACSIIYNGYIKYINIIAIAYVVLSGAISMTKLEVMMSLICSVSPQMAYYYFMEVLI